MKLFDILLPREGICTETSLFYKVIQGDAEYSGNALTIKDGATVSFDTFFNCFSAEKYGQYTGTDKVIIQLQIEGQADITVQSVTYGKRKTLAKTLLNGDNNSVEVDLKDCLKPGFAAFSLTAAGDCKVYGGCYKREQPASNKIKIGIIICTFKREKYVLANLQRVCSYLEDNSSLKDSFHFFVIDNGNTLDKSIQNAAVTLVANPNLGGSGGFSRGMYEVYQRSESDGFTHMLLMDDDIAFFPETLYKTMAFLACTTKDFADISMGGGMMRIDKPYHQHEFGALWLGYKVSSINGDSNLRKNEALIANERMDTPQYSAWWYMCMPVHFVAKHGLSLPFFIKGDDVEYALRACKHIVMLNGIGVWHEPFNIKVSAELEYYIKRNESIISSVYSPQSAFAHTRKLLRFTAFQLICFRYDWAKMYFKAYDDFLRGADYVNAIDMEALHKELRSYNTPTKTKQELMAEYKLDDIRFSALDKKQSPHLLRYTLNGYLIPKCFYRLCRYNKQGLRILNSSELKLRGFFCADKALIYNPHTETGYIAKQDKGKLFVYGFKLVAMFFKLLFRLPKANKDYQKNVEKMASVSSWKPKMKIT